MPYVATSAARQMRVFYPPPYGSLAPRAVRLTRRGMGDEATQVAASILGGAASIPSPATPFLALAATITSLMGQVFSGCGQTCTLTSDMANKLEGFLQQNLQLYFSSGRTQTENAAALNVFNQFWNQLTQYCGQASMGSAGQNCIGDRQAGACKWKASPPSWSGCNYSGAGAAGSGSACWNWWIGYHDPIANDPCVVPDPAAPQTYSTLSSTGQVVNTQTPAAPAASLLPAVPNVSIAGLSINPWLLAGGAAVVALLFFGGSR
jgi:hypothetical protein